MISIQLTPEMVLVTKEALRRYMEELTSERCGNISADSKAGIVDTMKVVGSVSQKLSLL